MNQLRISGSLGDAFERGPQAILVRPDHRQPAQLIRNSCSPRSVEPCRSRVARMVIPARIPQNPEQQHNASTGGEQHQGGDQSTPLP